VVSAWSKILHWGVECSAAVVGRQLTKGFLKKITLFFKFFNITEVRCLLYGELLLKNKLGPPSTYFL
jgi:hypothetical protein